MEKSDLAWKDVPGFPGYEVSEFGALRRGGKLLKPDPQAGSGRKRYKLTKDGKSCTKHAAHLVLLAFVGPKPFDDAEACHNDGFEHNNHYSNLRWGSHASNMNDVTMHRLRNRDQSSFPRSRGEKDSMAAAQFLATALRS